MAKIMDPSHGRNCQAYVVTPSFYLIVSCIRTKFPNGHYERIRVERSSITYAFCAGDSRFAIALPTFFGVYVYFILSIYLSIMNPLLAISRSPLIFIRRALREP